MAEVKKKTIIYKKEIGISFGIMFLLSLVFLALKLAQVAPFASMSWFLVFSPLWGPPAFVCALTFTLLGLIAIVCAIILVLAFLAEFFQ